MDKFPFRKERKGEGDQQRRSCGQALPVPDAPQDLDVTSALRHYFGFSSLRPGQQEAVQAAMEGKDSLVVMATGSGKSLCYQLPALAGSGGIVVVISPLISLMYDQVDLLAAP